MAFHSVINSWKLWKWNSIFSLCATGWKQRVLGTVTFHWASAPFLYISVCKTIYEMGFSVSYSDFPFCPLIMFHLIYILCVCKIRIRAHSTQKDTHTRFCHSCRRMCDLTYSRTVPTVSLQLYIIIVLVVHKKIERFKRQMCLYST